MSDGDNQPLSKEEAARIRLENQYAKYLKASASKSDLADLLRAGRISAAQAGEAEEKSEDAEHPPEVVEGLTRLAQWIQDVFHISCSKQLIKNWQNASPPFPQPISADYRYRWSEVAAWVERYKAKPASADGNAGWEVTEREKTLKAIAERKLREHELALVEGKYLPKVDVHRWAAGIGKILNAALDNRLELRLRTSALERFNQQPATPPLTGEQLLFVVDTFCALACEANAGAKEDLRKALCARPV